MSSAARRMIARRSRHGIAAQAGWAARAAATAVIDVAASCPSRRCPTSRSRSIGERASNVPVAVAPLAVDVVLVVPAELGLGLGDGRLEPGVELLVVGAERRVGDLDARCGIGGHGRRCPRAGRGVGTLRSV